METALAGDGIARQMVLRPHDSCVGGETRIVVVDRRSTVADLHAHLPGRHLSGVGEETRCLLKKEPINREHMKSGPAAIKLFGKTIHLHEGRATEEEAADDDGGPDSAPAAKMQVKEILLCSFVLLQLMMSIHVVVPSAVEMSVSDTKTVLRTDVFLQLSIFVTIVLMYLLMKRRGQGYDDGLVLLLFAAILLLCGLLHWVLSLALVKEYVFSKILINDAMFFTFLIILLLFTAGAISLEHAARRRQPYAALLPVHDVLKVPNTMTMEQIE